MFEQKSKKSYDLLDMFFNVFDYKNLNLIIRVWIFSRKSFARALSLMCGQNKKNSFFTEKIFVWAFFFGNGKIFLIQIQKCIHQSKALLSPKKLQNSSILSFKTLLFECFQKTKSFEKSEKHRK
jgi:hypothetical protein